MLPGASRQALEEFGAVQYELPPLPQFRNEHFTVVAARGGDDVWVEVRRRRVAVDDRVPEELLAPPPPPVEPALRLPIVATIPVLTTAASRPQPAAQDAAAPQSAAQPAARVEAAHVERSPIAASPNAEQIAARARHDEPPAAQDDDLLLPDADQLWPARNDEWEMREAARAGDEDEIDIDLDAPFDVEEAELEPIPHAAEREATAVAERQAREAAEREVIAAAERLAEERAAAEREAIAAAE